MIPTDPTTVALLNAVRADPESDLLRLVWADRLDELATNVECPECGGIGNSGVVGELRRCVRCDGDCWVPDGLAERAAIIRLQCDPEYVCDWHPRPEPVPSSSPMTLETKFHRNAWPGMTLVGWDDGWVCYSPTETWPSVSRTDVKWTRGFIAEVRCRLDWWVGEQCGSCGSSGAFRGYNQSANPGECPACSGVGRVNAHGPQVLAEHPVEQIMATGVSPFHSAHGEFGFDRWAFVTGNGGGDPQLRHLIPDIVWDVMDGRRDGRGARLYESHQSAIDDVGVGMIRWAKSKVKRG